MTEVVGLDGCTVTCVYPEKVELLWPQTPGEEDLAEVARVFKLLVPDAGSVALRPVGGG